MTTGLIDAVEAAARAVGDMALARWKGEGGAYQIWDKSPGHPVCDIDLAADRALQNHLAALDPAAGWLSEETADDPSRLGRARIWCVDPIDGTRDYIRGRSGWSVSIALVEDGTPIIGVLYAPARGEMWRAQRGAGATRNGVAVAASDRAELAGARVPADHLAQDDALLATVAKPNSIAMRIAMVAAGEADIVATLRWGHEWDVAAAALIAGEAGATVSDAFGAPLTFNKRDPRAFGVLATASAIHGAAVAHLDARARRIAPGQHGEARGPTGGSAPPDA